MINSAGTGCRSSSGGCRWDHCWGWWRTTTMPAATTSPQSGPLPRSFATSTLYNIRVKYTEQYVELDHTSFSNCFFDVTLLLKLGVRFVLFLLTPGRVFFIDHLFYFLRISKYVFFTNFLNVISPCIKFT